MEKYTVDLVFIVRCLDIFCDGISKWFLFKENKYVFSPIYTNSKDVRHQLTKRQDFKNPHRYRRKNKKLHVGYQRLPSGSAVPRNHSFSALGAVQRTTSFIRLWQ